MKADQKLSRKQKLQAQNREYILESALDLFLIKGFASTTMHDIAERSEFAVGTLYRFFDSKEHIYETLLKDSYRRIITHAIDVTRENEHKPPMECLQLMCVTVLTEMYNNSRLIKLYLNNATTPGKHASCAKRKEEFKKMDDEISRLHQECIVRCMDAGCIAKGDVLAVEIGMTALIDAYVKCIADEKMDYSPEDWFNTIIEPFLKGLS